MSNPEIYKTRKFEIAKPAIRKCKKDLPLVLLLLASLPAKFEAHPADLAGATTSKKAHLKKLKVNKGDGKLELGSNLRVDLRPCLLFWQLWTVVSVPTNLQGGLP